MKIQHNPHTLFSEDKVGSVLEPPLKRCFLQKKDKSLSFPFMVILL
jgi:hypothetical protein